MDWSHLRTFEALARLGSLGAAAKSLGLSQSTVSRHLARLEDHAGSPLVLRESPLRLTPRGLELRAAIEPMVDAALAAQSALEHSPQLRGRVSVTTVGEVLRWVLIPALPTFHQRYPHLRLQLLADNQVASLAAGEADIALRFMRPVRGELVAQRVLRETYALFVAPSVELTTNIPWLGLAGSLAEIPEQRIAAQAFADRPPRLLVEDLEGLGHAVAAGLGVAILPRGFAARLNLIEVDAKAAGATLRAPIPARDLWVVVLRSRQHLPRIRAVREWLLETIREV